MNRLMNLALSVGETLVHESGKLLFGIVLGRAKELLATPQPLGTRQLVLNRALQKKAVDGALLAGPRTGKEYAKFTLKKGLPTDQRPKTMAVENEPHSVDDFDYDKLRPSKTSAIALPYAWPAGSSQAPSRKEPCCGVSFTIPTEPPEWVDS